MEIYKNSRYENSECKCFVARDVNEKFLIVESGTKSGEFIGKDIELNGRTVKRCCLSVENSKIIRKIFPFTEPVSAKGRGMSIGLGDRLGLASPGHIKAIKDKDIFPILAQQSIRELNLTGRTYDKVLSDAVWAVLQEGYEMGYGADGDHLKTSKEVEMALDAGFSMITLDCSEYIGKDNIDDIDTSHMEKYKNTVVKVCENSELTISEEIFNETMKIYSGALCFVVDIYNSMLRKRKDIDFELSIDETMTPTKPEAHYLIAAWLKEKDVEILNIAPRFCGEFQKGIDYKGDLNQFEDEFILHSAIAEYFGHRLSIHSGSDKFKVFPIMGKLTKGNCHVKTAGTNWLEALRCISFTNPDLFKQMYAYSIESLNKAKAYYHIYTEKNMAPDVNEYINNISKLLDIDESRQILHVTYGFLLGSEAPFREAFFNTLNSNEELHYKLLKNHITRHLKSLMC